MKEFFKWLFNPKSLGVAFLSVAIHRHCNTWEFYSFVVGISLLISSIEEKIENFSG